MSRQELIVGLDPDDALNWADYIDALKHQDSRRNVRVSRRIEGRRLRDGFREEIEISKLVHPLARDA